LSRIASLLHDAVRLYRAHALQEDGTMAPFQIKAYGEFTMACPSCVAFIAAATQRLS
jgi:hypothetical protein